MSDNPTGADNQQERPSPDWVVGFVDGEGCFFVGINRQPSMTVGWQVLPEFRVVQHERDVSILERASHQRTQAVVRARGAVLRGESTADGEARKFCALRRGDPKDESRRPPDDGGAGRD